MPLRTETYDLADERDRLAAAEDAPLQHERGVRWAAEDAAASPVEPWDDDVDSVTLGGLDAGEMAHIEDLVASEDDAGPSLFQLHVVAAGTVSAPYTDDSDGHKQAFAQVARLPKSYVAWAYARIDELSTVGAPDVTGATDAEGN